MKLFKENFSILLALAVIPALIFIFSSMQVHAQEQKKRPNILLIVADDMGYSDLGS